MKEKWNEKRVKKIYPRNKCSKHNIKFLSSSQSFILILSVLLFPSLSDNKITTVVTSKKRGGVECLVISFNCELFLLLFFFCLAVHLWVLQWIALMSKTLKFSKKMCNKYQYGAQKNDLSFFLFDIFLLPCHTWLLFMDF